MRVDASSKAPACTLARAASRERRARWGRRIGREGGSPLEERGRRRQAAVREGAAGGPLEFGGDVLVRAQDGAGAVPGPAVGIHLRVGDVRERPVDIPPLFVGVAER